MAPSQREIARVNDKKLPKDFHELVKKVAYAVNVPFNLLINYYSSHLFYRREKANTR
jgi:hypothetical protein